ncbi:MAG: hypothetical protein M3Q95_08590 [Bacteroidota bacterium]|nr:hypothetical protein [Bacteroidota bacterium]
MNFQLVTEAPAWMLIFCPLAGFLYAWILYRNETTFAGISKWVTLLMAAMRFGVVTVLAILLLSPLIKTLFTEVERPLVIFLQDQSRSVMAVRDSAALKTDYPIAVNALQQELEKDFDVRVFRIGEDVKEGIDYNFNGSISDLSDPVSELRSRYAGRNLGAVILASDGIFNKGSNPLYTYQDLKVPVYTIGLGDTTVRKDLLISKVSHNRSAFSGNTFPVEITIDARQCAGQAVVFSITKDGKEVFTKSITIPTGRYNMLFPVFLEAGAKGINHYVVKVSHLEGESNYVNNQRDFFMEVIDSRQQVLIVAHSPHPDIAVFKSLLESNPNYQVRSVLFADFNGRTDSINVAILYQIPSVNQPATELLKKLEAQQVPTLFVLGSQSGIPVFNRLNTGISVTENNGNATEVFAEPANDFSFFTLEEEYLRRIRSFPPLISPFGTYNREREIGVLMNQRIGPVKTNMPLLYFGTIGEQKTAVFTGEGIWKWRLREHYEFNNTEAVTALLTKTIQYLATTEKKTPFRIFYKNAYNENEPVVMDAEFYNESGELVNVNEARITITDGNKNNYPFTFSRTGKSYSLEAGYLPVGSYSFTATTVSGKNTYTENGNFTISALQVELTETIADHQLLSALSDKTGGKFFLRNSMSQIAQDIKNKEDIRSVSYSQKRLDEVINLKLIFSLILLLLTIEWFMRKRSGGY